MTSGATGGGLGTVGVLPEGAWSPDLSHFPKPVTRATAAVLVGRLAAEACARWGVLLEGIDLAVDREGWVYSRDQPVTDRDEAVLRHAAATETVATRRWRAEADRWHQVTRPAVVAELLALQDEEIASYDDDALTDHVIRAAATARRLLDLHMELHLTDMLPLGALIAEAAAWGLEPESVVGLMRGASPASGPSAELDGARAAVAGAGSEVHWRELPEVAHFLRLEGHRLISEPEVGAPTLHEREDLVERLLRSERAEAAEPARDLLLEARSQVPAAARGRFDELLRDAQLTYGIRDDNTSLTAMWPLGLVRRVYREAAKRLPQLGAADDVFSLTPDELAIALRGGDLVVHPCAVPTAAPRPVGEWAPPDPALMNDAQRWLQSGFDAYGVHYDGAVTEPLTGTGIGDGTVSGPAVVAVSPLDALDRLEPGSILVVSATAPAYDAVLPLAAGLVVETGGLLSHAALAGRELGLPVVVGVSGATVLIADGEMVTVDAARGRVTRV